MELDGGLYYGDQEISDNTTKRNGYGVFKKGILYPLLSQLVLDTLIYSFLTPFLYIPCFVFCIVTNDAGNLTYEGRWQNDAFNRGVIIEFSNNKLTIMRGCFVNGKLNKWGTVEEI